MSLQNGAAVTEETVCYHCGDPVAEAGVVHSGKVFCCSGCKLVYEILEESNLCDYYRLERTPGSSPRIPDDGRYKYLDEATGDYVQVRWAPTSKEFKDFWLVWM